MDNDLVARLALLVGLPAWGALLIYAMRTVKVWPEIQSRFNERFRDRAAISNTDWKSLREQIEWLTEEVKECRKSEGEWMRRAIVAESINQGHGEVRQAAASAAAEQRVDESKAPTAVRRFSRKNSEEPE